MHTLAVDIGGSSVRLVALDEEGAAATETLTQPTPQPATPGALVRLIHDMADTVPPLRRISVGFPGVVKEGMTWNAPNLGSELWDRVPLRDQLVERFGHPVRVVNDVDLQGLGVSRGNGVELVITLGTGMGTALLTEGALVPNLELGHHPFRDGKTYEDLVRDSELKRIGPVDWTKRVIAALEQLGPIFNYDVLHLGGGNVRHLGTALPQNVRIFDHAEAMRGAMRVWGDA